MGMCPIPYLVFVTDSKWLLIFILCFIGEFVFLSKKESEIDCIWGLSCTFAAELLEMRIGYDGKRAVQNFTGLGNYSRYVVQSLSAFAPENEYWLYAPGTPWKSATLVDGGRKPGNGIGTLSVSLALERNDFVVARGRYTQDFETGQHTAVPRTE